MKLQPVLALLILVTAASISRAAETGWLDDRTPDHELLTLADGLSDSTVFSVDQDAQGRIWMGTASGGANAFDGHQLQAFVYEPSSNSLSHSAAGQVFVDSAGTVFVGTWGGGLNRLISPEGRFERLNPDSAPLRIQTLFEDTDGRLWVGSSGDGLLLFDGASSFSPVRRQDDRPLERIWGLAQSENGRLWVAADAGLFELDGDNLRVTPIDALVDDHPRTLATTEGRLWMGGNAGLYSMSLVTGATDLIAAELPAINVLQRAPDGRLVVGTLAGLFAIDPATNGLVPPVAGGPLRLFPDRNIRDIDYDRTGMIWLATREAGVIKLTGRRTGFDGYVTDEQLETVDTVVELSPDEFLIGSRRGLWRLYRSPDGPRLDQVPGSASYFVNQLVIGQDRIFVATRSGLRLYDPRARALLTDPAFGPLEGVSVTVVHPVPDGSLWLGTWAEGLFHLPAGGGEMQRYWTGGSPALPDDYLSVIVPDATGGLWLGHWYEGLSRLVPETGELQRFVARPDDPTALPIGHVHSAALDDEAIWVGTNFGLARLEFATGEVTRTSVSRQGLPTSVQRLELDAAGNLWIASTRGIKRLDPATGALVHYGEADGLVTTEFYARSGARGADGTVYFGGVGGLVSFDPTLVVDRFSPPEVFITGAFVDGEVLSLESGELEVPPGSRELRFAFGAADYKDPVENRYQYRMIGENDEWSEPGAENVVGFAALPAGDYRFSVRAGNSNGVWSLNEPVSVDVTVLPFWWQTWSGRLAIVAGLLLLIYGVHNRRTARIRAANRKLEAEVTRQTRDLTRVNERLAKAASTDFLTGLPNRRGFFDALEASESFRPGTIALADIDDFKSLNDRFGHDLGDLALRKVAEAVESAVRPQDLVARWGGEEFIFFFADVGLDAAEHIAERVRETVEGVELPSEFGRRPVSVTMGIALRNENESIERCIDRADQGLYAGKQAGKNRVVRAA